MPCFSYIDVASTPIHGFIEFLLPVVCTIISLSHWLIIKIMICDERLIDWMVFNIVFNSISVISQWPVHLSMHSWSPFNQFSAPNPFKPLAAFPHCRNKGQRWERNECSHNDYHQSSERILASQETNQRPLVLKSATLLTELWGLGQWWERKECHSVISIRTAADQGGIWTITTLFFKSRAQLTSTALRHWLFNWGPTGITKDRVNWHFQIV